ncbi:MAG: hypothetical protein CSA11_01970 [Chloroflexi bacterium]|nr:MAG: hypothetical protein CSA11_01970 [Chloroflexota bacterium]
MVKKVNILGYGMMILGVVLLLAACTRHEQETVSPTLASTPTADVALTEAALPPIPDPTLAMPPVSITAVPTSTALPPSPTMEIAAAATETAVPPTEASPIVYTPVPLPTPAGIYSWTLRVPILMYHYISHPPEDADIYRTDLSVTPENFRQQMAYLAENGYTPIDLYQLSAAITAKTELPEKPVVLTFDDGYLDNYENAFPILQEFSFIGTFFVITNLVDQGAAGYANWEQLEEMAAAGMRIESHTKDHPDLSEKDREGVIFQVLGAQETIAAHIGYMPRYLCYPGGRYTEETMQVLADLDLWGAVTTQGGTWHGFTDRYEWSRQRMRYDTTLEQFILFVDPDGTAGGKSLTE